MHSYHLYMFRWYPCCGKSTNTNESICLNIIEKCNEKKIKKITATLYYTNNKSNWIDFNCGLCSTPIVCMTVSISDATHIHTYERVFVSYSRAKINSVHRLLLLFHNSFSVLFSYASIPSSPFLPPKKNLLYALLISIHTTKNYTELLLNVLFVNQIRDNKWKKWNETFLKPKKKILKSLPTKKF